MDEQRQCDREPDDRDRDAVAISAWFESVHRQRAAWLAVGIANGCRGRSAHSRSIALATVRVTHLAQSRSRRAGLSVSEAPRWVGRFGIVPLRLRRRSTALVTLFREIRPPTGLNVKEWRH